MKLTISGTVPSLKNSKQLFVNKRTGKTFITSSQRSKTWVSDALWQLKGKEAVIDYPAMITMEFYFADKRRRDLDNVCASVMDVLRQAEIIEDDDYTHFPEIRLGYSGLDKQNPRVEITIMSLQRAY